MILELGEGPNAQRSDSSPADNDQGAKILPRDCKCTIDAGTAAYYLIKETSTWVGR